MLALPIVQGRTRRVNASTRYRGRESGESPSPRKFLVSAHRNNRPVETRWCPRCLSHRSMECFGWRDKAHQRKQSYCRDCTRETWREWYRDERNHKHHLALVSARRKRRIARHREVVLALKSVPCADCGRAFPPEVMDFDHLSHKKGEISSLMYTHGTNILLTELAKCEVVCANCHRIRTANRRKGQSATSPRGT